MKEIEDSKEVWLVQSNTDLTEGRGEEFFQYVCELEATALRKAKRNYVMGSDSPIRKGNAYYIGGQWYYPSVKVERITPEDRALQQQMDKEKEEANFKEQVLLKVKKLGLSDEEIQALKG